MEITRNGGAEPRLLRAGLLAGAGLAGLLVLATLIQYPGTTSEGIPAAVVAGGALCIFVALGAGAARWGGRTPPLGGELACRWGTATGIVFGVLWVLEISFNNFLPPDVSTVDARFGVDNGTWAAIALGMIGTAAVAAFRTRRLQPGVGAGVWSGLVSGLIACLMGLLLVALGMRALLQDPLNIQEYAARGPASQAPDMATYFAYDTMAGALLHLVVLGLMMGALLGVVGGVLGWGLRAAVRR